MKARGEVVGDSKEEEKTDDMSAVDKKKAKHAAKRKQKAEDDKKQAGQKTAPGKAPKTVDEDPDGNKLLEKDHLEEASKLVKTLVLNCGDDTATHKLQYDVFSQQKKLLPCVQALVQLYRLCGQNA